MNIAAGVPALQTFHLYFAEEISGRHIHLLIGKLGNRVYAACTADKKFALVFGVEVQENITAHKTFLQSKSTRQSGFFVYGEQTFYRTMFNAVIGKDSQFGCYTDTVIRPQRCAFGFQPFSVYLGFDRVGEEIMFYIVVLLAYHVHMRLKHNCFSIFHTRSGKLLYQYVSGFIHFRFQLMFFSECF